MIIAIINSPLRAERKEKEMKEKEVTLDSVLQDDRFTGNDNYKKPKSEYIKKVFAMTEEQLQDEAERKIWLSAYANNNPRSDYHWQVDVLWLTCKKFPGLYEKAFDNVKRSVSGN